MSKFCGRDSRPTFTFGYVELVAVRVYGEVSGTVEDQG